MKRLTEKRESPLVMSMWAKDSQSLRIYNRLAAIEDILCDGEDDYDLDRLAVMCNQRMTMRDEVSERFGLAKDIPLDRLRELVEADREGRCVVLPCKVGRSLWVHDKDGKPREMELDPPDIRCHCRDEDNLCMALCGAKKTGVCAYRLRNDGTDIGKTVFLTREAAEAALKGEANG